MQHTWPLQRLAKRPIMSQTVEREAMQIRSFVYRPHTERYRLATNLLSLWFTHKTEKSSIRFAIVRQQNEQKLETFD